MISFTVCRKCPFGKFNKGKKDGYEKFIFFPTVECDKNWKNGIYLSLADEVPQECPYAMEHVVLCQDIPANFAKTMGRV